MKSATNPLLVLFILSLTSLLPAQGGPICGNPGSGTSLSMEVDLGQGPQWYCPLLADNISTFATRLRLVAPKGSWTTVIPRVYVSGTGASADQLRANYPWLDINDTPLDPGTIYSGWAGQPHIVVDFDRVWWFIQHGILDPYTLQISDTAVRDLYVPILENINDPAATHNARIWDARPQGWLANQSGNFVGPTISAIWNGMLLDPSGGGDPETFSLEGLARTAILLQAPSLASANAFMESEDFYKALEFGLSVDLQAVTMMASTNVVPGTDDLNAPGLGLPALPGVSFSPPITITVAIAAPATNGTGGGNFNNVGPNIGIAFDAYGVVPQPTGPAEMIFRDAANNPLPPVIIQSDANLRTPFRRIVVPPVGVAPSSSVDIISGNVATGNSMTTSVALVPLLPFP